MDDSTGRVVAYRQAHRGCFTRARDALFDLCDVLATAPPLHRSRLPVCLQESVALGDALAVGVEHDVADSARLGCRHHLHDPRMDGRLAADWQVARLMLRAR